MQMLTLYSNNDMQYNGIILVICDIDQLVNPSNTENMTFITGVAATILIVVFIQR